MEELTVINNTTLPETIPDLAKFALVGREKLTAVRAEMSAIDKVGLAREVLEQKKQEAQDIAEIVTLSEVKIGKMLREIPKATKDNNPSGLSKDDTQIRGGSKLGQTKTEILKENNITKDAASAYQQMAEHEEIVKQAIEEARANDDIVSRSFVLEKIRQEKRAEKERNREAKRSSNAEKVQSLSSPLEAQGLFQTIVIDPPWDWGDEGDDNQLGRARPDYTTMPLEEIAALPVGKIADENCHLYLWVTNRSLPKAFELVKAWGFRYITCLTWVKPSFGMGNYFRGDTEQVIFAVKGSQLLKRRDVGTHFNAPRGDKHSAKPDEFYRLVESCSYEPYIDIFGRKEREGWAVWGEGS